MSEPGFGVITAGAGDQQDPTSPIGYYVPEQVPINSTSRAYENNRIVSAGAARLFGFQGYNSGPAQFILIFDLIKVPANGKIPDAFPIAVPATSNFSAYLGSVGRWFNGGIVLCNSSTGPTLTIGAADCWFDVQFV